MTVSPRVGCARRKMRPSAAPSASRATPCSGDAGSAIASAATRADAGGQLRTAGDGRDGEARVAEFHAYPCRRNAERVGCDLGERRICAGADVDAAAANDRGSVGANLGACRRGTAVRRVGRGSHSEANEIAAVAHRSGLYPAPLPIERRGAGGIACAQRFARERDVLGGIGARVIAQAQFDRIETGRVGKLVHRRFERERAARLAGRAHIGWRADVEPGQAMRDPQCW